MPADGFDAVAAVLARLLAVPQAVETRGPSCSIVGLISVARVHELQQRLPALTHGEGVLESEFDSYQPVQGEAPSRLRTDYNPLDRKEYLLHVLRRV
jgi:ribosomal protection tetracycline resistance protein